MRKCFDGGQFANHLEDLGGGRAVQVAENAVVAENADLVVGEAGGEEIVVGFFAGVVRIAFHGFFAECGGGGGEMVSVGDVEGLDFRKGDLDLSDFFGILYEPSGVVYSVFGVEREAGFSVGERFEQGVEIIAGFIEKKNGSGMGAGSANVAGAFFDFVEAGQLMIFDDAGAEFFAGRKADDAGLGMVFGAETVNHETGLGIADEGVFFDKFAEIFGGAGVNFVGEGFGHFLESDFTAGDVEESV